MDTSQLAYLRASASRIVADAERCSAAFYERLFSLDPALRPLFSPNIGPQRKRFLQMIDTAVFASDKPAMLKPLLRQLGQRHVAYGARPDHYATVGAALLWAIEHALGEEFTPEVREAWESFYALAARTMQEGAQESPAAPPWELPAE